MKTPFNTSRCNGTALLLTLWCVAVISIAVVTLARLVDSDTEIESLRSRRFEAREIALTGIAYASNPKVKRDSELLHQTIGENGELSVKVSSEAARLNINLLLRQPEHRTLKKLFDLWGVPDSDIRVAVDSLIDWTDANGTRQLNGAERDDLEGQTKYSLPQNRNFFAVAEMRKVRGMDVVAEHKSDWEEYFSVFSGPLIDLQDAAPDILRASGLSGEQVEQLVRFRNGQDRIQGTTDDQIFKSLEEAFQRLGISATQAKTLKGVFTIGAEPTRVQSTGKIGGIDFRIAAVVNRGANGAARLSWEEQ